MGFSDLDDLMKVYGGYPDEQIAKLLKTLGGPTNPSEIK
jgi:hypothetical protein